MFKNLVKNPVVDFNTLLVRFKLAGYKNKDVANMFNRSSVIISGYAKGAKPLSGDMLFFLNLALNMEEVGISKKEIINNFNSMFVK